MTSTEELSTPSYFCPTFEIDNSKDISQISVNFISMQLTTRASRIRQMLKKEMWLL